MNKNKVRGLKWNLKKFRGSVLHFTILFFINNLVIYNQDTYLGWEELPIYAKEQLIMFIWIVQTFNLFLEFYERLAQYLYLSYFCLLCSLNNVVIHILCTINNVMLRQFKVRILWVLQQMKVCEHTMLNNDKE